MSANVFYSALCLSDMMLSIKKKELGVLFRGADKRYLSQTLHKFVEYNQEAFCFLEVSPLIIGIDPNVEMAFNTNRYIGAIPMRTPVNGKQIGDFVVRPRFSDDQFLFSQLTSILMMLKESVEPEYLDSLPLASGEMVRPPRYYDALKFVMAYENAIKSNWQKFRSLEMEHPFPKASTNWMKYIKNEYQVSRRLIFPSKDNEMSPQHLEWQQAKMVFELAKGELLRPTTPMTIRLQMKSKLQTLTVKTEGIQPKPVDSFTIHAFDPVFVKQMKEKGNIFLHAFGKEVSAWRIDIAILFEKYVQHLLQTIVREMPVKFYKNPRFPSRGYLPAWGLKHLEPDALIEAEHMSIAMDAKYKVHFYSRNQTSLLLKETHRADLHQILSYCSFSTAKHKAGMLFYPADVYSSQSFNYSNQYNGTRTEVIIVGLPFEAELKPETMQGLAKLLNEVLKPIPA